MNLAKFVFVLMFSLLMGACNQNKGIKSKVEEPFKESLKSYSVSFYNVENLFDTIDHPDFIDEWFLPESKTKWNTERYQKKLVDLNKILHATANNQLPIFFGLCEVENRQVVLDLIAKNSNADEYELVHQDSPDARGIDVAFVYNKNHFKLIKKDFYKIQFPSPFDSITTREILHAYGKVDGQAIHFFVNHWPSRRGGLEASEPKRVETARVLREKVDEIFKSNPQANIVIMGDFNDEPDNKSVSEILKAQSPELDLQDNQLYNLMYQADQSGVGTYNYKGNWNMLDQFIVSGNMLQAGNKLMAKSKEGSIYRESWMMYSDKKYGETPNRTYGGPNYYGGYSDHLPIFFEFSSN